VTICTKSDWRASDLLSPWQTSQRWTMQMTAWRLGSQDCRRCAGCGEAGGQGRAPVSKAHACSCLCRVKCAVWCAAGCAPPRLHSAAESGGLSLFLHPHPSAQRGCSILVDQTSNNRGHLRPPPSWWCVRPCAFVSYSIPLTAAIRSNPIILGVRAQQRRSGSIFTTYTQRYPSSIHFMI
jgi:hypothetical protein